MARGAAFALGTILFFLSFVPKAWTSGQGDGLAFPALVKAAVGELDIAITHADLAQSADSVRVAKHHLQHVVNCLEGANGKDYKNPFQGANSFCGAIQVQAKDTGIIPGLEVADRWAVDVDSARRNARASLTAALAGLAKSNINGIRGSAASALRYLKAARAAIG